MSKRSHVCLYCLTRERSSRGICKSTTRHDRNLNTSLFLYVADCLDSSLCVEGIEDSLNKDDISTSVKKSANTIRVGLNKVLESNLAGSRIVYICRHRGCLVRRAHRASHDFTLSTFYFTLNSHLCSRLRNLIHFILQSIVGKREAVTVEGVCLDDVSTSVDIVAMHLLDSLRFRDTQHIITPLQRKRVIAENCATEIILGEP